jgi:hypothetical protein
MPDWFDKKAEKGCEFCGRRIPYLPNNGLEKAHIIADDFGPKHQWNLFVLCPTCHKVLDEVVKPGIIAALSVAADGFSRNGSNNEKRYRIGNDYQDLVARLEAVNKKPKDTKKINAELDKWPPIGVSANEESAS